LSSTYGKSKSGIKKDGITNTTTIYKLKKYLKKVLTRISLDISSGGSTIILNIDTLRNLRV